MASLAGSYTTTKSYKQNGLPDVLNLPAIKTLPAETLYYGYANFDNPISVDNETWDILAGNAQYDVLGNLSSFEQSEPNSLNPSVESAGLQTNYFKWDATTGRLSKQTTTNWAKNQTRTVGETAYSYDPAGKIAAKTSPEEVECYNYDYAERLTGAWTPSNRSCASGFSPTGLGGPAPYAQQYSYTAAGDRAQVKRYNASGVLSLTEDYAYPAAGAVGAHRAQKVTTTPAGAAAATHTLGWNDGGQLTNRAGQSLAYTADGKLRTNATATLPVNPNARPASTGTRGTGTRFYDAAGSLVGITDGTGTTALLADATVHVSATGAATGTRSISFAGQTVAQRVTTTTGTKIQFLTPDVVNTSTAITQSISGAPGTASTKRYSDPFGLERGQTQAASTANNAANPAGFSAANGYLSGLADAGTSLTHLGARDYDPALGIFTAPDPIYNWGSQGGYSPFTYSNNDPVNQSDASGLVAIPIPAVPAPPPILIGIIVGVLVASLIVDYYAKRYRDSMPSRGGGGGSYSPAQEAITSDPNATLRFDRPSVRTIPAAAAPPTWVTTYPTAYPGPRGRQGSGSGGPTTSVSQAAAAAAAAAAAEAARIAALIAQNAAMHAASSAAVAQMGNKNNADNAASAGSPGAIGGASGGALPPDDEDRWKEANRASTGRTEPRTLEEKLAMEQVRSNPDKGKVIARRIGDPRYNDGNWEKVQQIINLGDGTKINIHFIRNVAKRLMDDFKFK